MRSYELTIIVVPETGNDGVEDIRKVISETLEKEAGQLTSLSVWRERQKLAYTLRSRGAQKRKYNEATYLLAEYSLDTSKLGRLKYVLDLDERVLRYMNVNKGEANG
jgi:ribosomal protein S6